MSKSIKELTEDQALEVRNVKCSEPTREQRRHEAQIREGVEADDPVLIAARSSEFIEDLHPRHPADRPGQAVARRQVVLSLSTSETDVRWKHQLGRLRLLVARVFALLIRRGAGR